MYTILAIVLVGWLGGSLVNYLADFLPVDHKIVTPYCLNCKSPRSITNYLLFPKRCEQCNQRVSMRFWTVNLFFILMCVYFWLNPAVQLEIWLQLLLLAYFTLVVVIDLEHRLILHIVSLAGAVLGLYVGILNHGLVSTLIGGLAGLSIMYILYQGGRLFVRILAKWRDYSDIDEALGFGDVTLSGVIGLMLGWPGIVLGLILAVLLAGAVSLIYMVILLVTHRYRVNLTIAYGPYLILSALILVLFKDLLQGF